MGTSTRTHNARMGARRTPRRATCSAAPAKHDTPGPSDVLRVTIRVTPLADPESNPLRAQQLAVIVNLLRRAAAEVTGG